MNIKIEHRLSRDEAKRRLEGLIQTLKTEYGDQIRDLSEQWTGYANKISGSAKGYSVSGTIEIEELAVIIDLKIPLFLQVFGKKIRSLIDQQVKNALS